MVNEKPIVRLFIVRGTFEALTALCLVQEESEEKIAYEDYVLITDFSVPLEQNRAITQTITDILGAHAWKGICNITEHDKIILRYQARMEYRASYALIKELLGLDEVDRIYVPTNARGTSISITRAYTPAAVCIMGDGTGILDSAVGFGVSNIESFRPFLPISFSRGLTLCAPFKPLRRQTMRTIIENYCENNQHLKAAAKKYESTLENRKCALLSTQVYTEFKYFTFEDEIKIYVDAVEKNCDTDELVVIKEHPRTYAADKIKTLMKELNLRGYECLYIDDESLRFLPVEAFCYFFPFSKAVCVTSTVGLTLNYLYGTEIDDGLDAAMVPKLLNGEYLSIFNDAIQQALANLATWDGKTLLLETEKDPFNYRIIVRETVETTNPGVPSITVESILLRLGEMVADNDTVSRFFVSQGIRRLVVYGVGKMGKAMIRTLVREGQLELVLADKNKGIALFEGLPVYCLEEVDSNADAVFIAILRNPGEIKETIINTGLFNNKPVYTLQDVFFPG